MQGVADGETGGDTKEAGLPNITGSFKTGYLITQKNGTGTDGALVSPQTTTASKYGGSAPSIDWGGGFLLDASKGETKADGTLKTDDDYKVYGKSDTVQPPAFLVHIFQRTA